MEGMVPPTVVLRFDAFEVDLGAGEVRKNGRRLKLHGQPFQVLAALLERPGEVVTRGELRTKLWPSDTFVDFDHSLNVAVNRIREALGDSVESPRFVQTLPRRGYRFIAHLESDTGQRTATALATVAVKHSQTSLHSAATTVALLCIVLVLLLPFSLRRRPTLPKIVKYSQITNDGHAKGPLASDGSRLYMVEESSGGSILTQVSIEGGDTFPVFVPLKVPVLLDISPNGSQLLLVDDVGHLDIDRPLWVSPTLGGSPRQLADVLAHDASWSPDGEQIVYARDNNLYLAKNDGTASRRLVALPGRAWRPRWSPDGRRLRFTVSDPHRHSVSLWEIGADGNHLRALLPGWNNIPRECCGNWTPDGKYFVFQSDDGGKRDIWAIAERESSFHKAGAEPVRLTTGPMSFSDPLPAKDGRRLFVVGTIRRGELMRYDAKSRQFVPYLFGLSAEMVDPSRDGHWITYSAYPEGTLWRSKADGSDRLQLTFPPMQAYLPRWSPDGRRIAFIARIPGRPLKIYVVSADGGTPEQLIPGENRNEAAPTWSPDGNSIIFGELQLLEGGPSNSYAIRVLDLKARQVRDVPGSQGLFAPRVSPDGRHIVALTTDAQKLMLFDSATQKWEELASVPAISPNWSHDGRYVYFNNLGFEREPAIFRVRISDRKLERLAGLHNLTRVSLGNWAPGGGLAPDDSPLVLYDAGTQEIYALEWQAP